jgi:hypothetical protein
MRELTSWVPGGPRLADSEAVAVAVAVFMHGISGSVPARHGIE